MIIQILKIIRTSDLRDERLKGGKGENDFEFE